MTEGFRFGSEEMEIGQYTLTREQIEDSRAMMAVSFGSCSWQEPLDDLKALGFREPTQFNPLDQIPGARQ